MTTNELENAMAFAEADSHDGDVRTVLRQAKAACRTLAAEVDRQKTERDDLALLLRRACRRLGESDFTSKAIDYLKRKQLLGSPLRVPE